MITPITNPSAINYWLNEALSPEPFLTYTDLSLSETASADIMRDAKIFHIDPPIALLYSKDSYRRRQKEISPHVLGNMHLCNFVKLTESLYIISPETAFLLEARHRTLPELVNLACNLCAIYKPDPFSPYGQIKRAQITTVSSITDYLSGLHNMPGGRKARQAIAYALDNSNSPMESIFAAIFRLPFFLGGGDIFDISLNRKSYLTPNAAEFLGRDYCTCDISSNLRKVVFEYDSNLTHLNPDQHSYDKKRATALQMSGYSVFTITASDLKDHLSLDKMLLSAREALGLRTHYDRFNKYRDIRWNTYNQLIFKRHRF